MIYLLLTILSFPPDATLVRVSDGWPERITTTNMEPLGPGESVWWWSTECAPQKVAADRPEIACSATVERRVNVIAKGGEKALPGARVIWASEEMLGEVPDAFLPGAVTDRNGEAVLHVPPHGRLYVRVNGPRFASWWQEASASVRLSAVPATETFVQVLPPSRTTVDLELPELTVSRSGPSSRSFSNDGRMTLPLLPPVPFTILALNDTSVPYVTTGRLSSLPSRLELDRGVSVAGRVVDDARHPLSGVFVEAVFMADGISHGLHRRIRTSSNGRFLLSGLPSAPIQLTIKDSGRATALRRIETDTDFDLGDVTLGASREILVRVVELDGSAIPGATLLTNTGVRAISDRNGSATLKNVPANEALTISAAASRFRAAKILIESKDESEVVIELSRGVRVTGSVMNDETGEPASGGNVLIDNNGTRRVVAFSGDSFDISGLEKGTLGIEVRPRGLTPASFGDRPVIENETWDLGVLALSPGTTIRGRVSSRDEDLPIADAIVRALRRQEAGTAGAFVMRDWVSARTDEGGSFDVSGLPSGAHVLIVEAPGFAPWIRRVERDTMAVVTLDRARTIAVDCNPVARCGTEVRLLYGGAEYPWAMTAAAFRDGRAEIGTAAPGLAILRLVEGNRSIHERSLMVSRDAITPVHIRLATTRLRGSVVSAGRPHPFGSIHLRRTRPPSDGLPVYLESRTPEGTAARGEWLDPPSLPRTASVDRKGRFQFDDVEPGSYHVSFSGDLGISAPREVVIPEAPAYDLTFELSPGSLAGRVLVDGGLGAEFATVRIIDATGVESTTLTDRTGHFAVVGLFAGRARVTAYRGELYGAGEVDLDGRTRAAIVLTLEKRGSAP